MAMGCSCSSCARRSSCCSASEDATGGFAGIAGDFFLVVVCLGAVVCCVLVCSARAAATLEFGTQRHSAMGTTGRRRNALRFRALHSSELAPQNRRGVRILAEGRWVSLAQNLHHPVIEVIDGMIKDGLKTPVIFFMSFLNIISQTHANVFLFATQPNVVRTEHLNILHRNFGNTVCPPMQILLFGKQR